MSATIRTVYAAALLLLGTLPLSACNQPIQIPSTPATSGDALPRFGALPANARQMFDAVSLTADVCSEIYDTRSYSDAWIGVSFAGMGVGTNAVAKIELLHGTGDTQAELLPLPIDLATMVTSGTLPTGVALDAGGDGFDITDNFETNSRLFFVMRNVPPRLQLCFDRTSGGTGATISAVMFLH